MFYVSGGGFIDLFDIDFLQEWINMIGFFCVFGGVCFQQRSNFGLVIYSLFMGLVNECKGFMILVMFLEGNIDIFVSKFMDWFLFLMVCNYEKVGF